MLPYDKNKIHYVGATCGRPFVYKCNIFSAQDPSLRSRMTGVLFGKATFSFGTGAYGMLPYKKIKIHNVGAIHESPDFY